MSHVLIIEDSYLFGQFVSDAAMLAGAGSVEVVRRLGHAELEGESRVVGSPGDAPAEGGMGRGRAGRAGAVTRLEVDESDAVALPDTVRGQFHRHALALYGRQRDVVDVESEVERLHCGRLRPDGEGLAARERLRPEDGLERDGDVHRRVDDDLRSAAPYARRRRQHPVDITAVKVHSR